MSHDRTTRRLLAGCVIACALALLLSPIAISLSYRAPDGEEQPKVTDWMQAWGSLAGVLAGLLAAGAAALLLLHERKRATEAERQLDEERAEADLSAPRSVVLTQARFGGQEYAGEGFADQMTLQLQNYGAFPIRNVALIVSLPDDVGHVLLPRFSLIRPGGEQQIDRNFSPGFRVLGPRSLSRMRGLVTACFIDHAGQAWQVTSDGEVSRTKIPYPGVETVAALPNTVRLDVR